MVPHTLPLSADISHMSYDICRPSLEMLLGAQLGMPARPQRWAEVCAVTELVNLKLLMLCVHQGRVDEAVAQVGAASARPAAALHLHCAQTGLLGRVLGARLQDVHTGAACVYVAQGPFTQCFRH